jgi:methylmalonyl-CoA mutase
MGQPPVAHEEMPLAEGFEPRTREDWQELVAGVLNRRRPEDDRLDGKAAEAALRTVLEGGLTTDPLYLREDRPLGLPGAAPFTRGRVLRDAATAWDVRQLHEDPDVGRSRAAVLDDLEHGVTSVWVHVGPDGVPVGDLGTVLADVRFDLAPVVVSSWTDQAGAARALLDVVGDRGSAGGELGLDPVGAAARTGRTPDLDHLPDLVRSCADRDGWHAITVDARVLHDAGTSVVDAVAAAVATGVEYLRRLEADGIAPDEAFAHIAFRVPVTQDQFLTAASLRALRLVWARVGEACGVPEADRGARIHAVTSLRMMTREDPWVNILRSTLAVFGASIGAADAVTVLPHDTVAGLPGRFSRRLARNTQILLADESNVGRVTDPGGGSWYLESLTDDVAATVWTRFQQLEAAGGAVRALADGVLREWADAATEERRAEVATRRRPVTGVSMFPTLTDLTPERRPRAHLEVAPDAFVPRRDAVVFETLRDRARALGEPGVVVRALGPQREHGTRLTFVTNLLAAGGLRPVQEGPPVAILASSPAGYAEHAAAAIEELRDAGVETVLVAGRRSELGDAADRVDGEVRDGQDVAALLDDLLTRLGAPAEGART